MKMDTFSSEDYKALNNKLSAKKAYKYEDVKHRLIKVAFDIVKFRDADASIDGLWQIQNTDDGEVIVAMYEEKPELEVKSNWTTALDKTASNINVFYKHEFITKFSSSDLPEDTNVDIKKLAEHLPDSLDSNKSLRNAFLINLLTNDERETFLSKNPELK